MLKTGKLSDKKRFIHIILLFLILFLSYKQLYQELNSTYIIIFYTICVLLITNDYLRYNDKKYNYWYYPSIILSIILASMIMYLAPDLLVINYYYFFIVLEILNSKNKKRLLLFIIHFFLYITTVILKLKGLTGHHILYITEFAIVIYYSVAYILYIFHSNYVEKEEAKKLNEKLKSANIKLHEYSQKVEELSVARERDRVAQELHDSLGHSLMALIMHLEFAEKAFSSDTEKTKEVIVKAREIAKSSTSTLRKAVTTLKQERNIESLKTSIDELLNNFRTLGDIKIDLTIGKNIENLNPDSKLCVYKTIRESMTNGVKHGQATFFKLELFIRKDFMLLYIKDNGKGCKKITSSNGLKGIEDRVTALGGSVDFKSQLNRGFLTKVEIPVFQQL